MPNINEICPFANNDKNHNSRYNPKNAKIAYLFQFHDLLRSMLAIASINNDKSWNQQLDVLETHIKSARKV